MKRYLRGLKNVFKNPRMVIQYLNRYGLLSFLNDNSFHKLMYWANTGRNLNLKNPKGFNEKLHWLMIYDRNSKYTIMADKYKVREYIENKIGKEYLIPLIGVYNKPEEIDFDKLPKKFVLKCNHNSGLGMCICKNKDDLDCEKVVNDLKLGLKNNLYSYAREWCYKNIEPKIICEQYMENKEIKDKKINGLIDYKFYCFNGIPKFLYAGYANIINNEKHDLLTYYDLDFNKTVFSRPDHLELPFDVKKPNNINEMIEICKTLSANIPFVRVDLYEINNKVYFSELTLYPGAGYSIFYPQEWENEIGNWINIDALRENKMLQGSKK